LKKIVQNFYRFLIISGFIMNSGYIFAQLKVITLEEAISRALNNNNQILSSKYGLEQARWNTKRAWAEFFPTLYFNTRFTRIDRQTFEERDFRRYLPPEISKTMPQTVFQESYYSSFEVNMPLFNGILLNGIAIANKNETMAAKMNSSTRQNIVFLVISSYLNVLKTKDVYLLQKEYLKLSRLNYEKAERLYKANRYSKTEVLRWKVELEEQKSKVVSSKSKLRSAITNLNRHIKLNVDANTKVEVNLPRELKLETDKILALSDQEMLNMILLTEEQLVKINSALAAQKAGTEVSKLLYKNNYASYLPKVDASYTYSWRENNTIGLDDYSPKTLSINFKVPIFTGFQNYTKLKSSYYEYKKKEEKLNNDIANTKYLLTETINRIINLRTQKNLSNTSVEYSKSNYRTVETQKEKGLVSNIDFIDAKLNLQNAKLNHLSINYDLITTIVELYYMLGKVESVIQ